MNKKPTKFISILKNPWIWAFVFGALTMHLVRPLLRHIPDPPPVVGALPAFQLTNQDGGAFGSDELRGKVYVANLFFTSCPTVCPIIMQSMKTLQDRFAKSKIDIQLVSITVDPVNDKPNVLKTYAGKLGADHSNWSFLTGSIENIRSVVEGLGTHFGEREKLSEDVYDIVHATKFFLIDQEGKIRGYYDSDETGSDEIFHRSQHVLEEKKS